MKKWILKKIHKPLADNGLGDTPGALHRLLHRPDMLPNAIAYALIEHCGVFDSLGLAFFAARVMKKIAPATPSCKTKGVTKHATTGK